MDVKPSSQIIEDSKLVTPLKPAAPKTGLTPRIQDVNPLPEVTKTNQLKKWADKENKAEKANDLNDLEKTKKLADKKDQVIFNVPEIREKEKDMKEKETFAEEKEVTDSMAAAVALRITRFCRVLGLLAINLFTPYYMHGTLPPACELPMSLCVSIKHKTFVLHSNVIQMFCVCWVDASNFFVQEPFLLNFSNYQNR